MRILGSIILIQISSLVVIVACLLLLHTDLSLVLKTTYNAGPPVIDPSPLTAERRLNIPDTIQKDNESNVGIPLLLPSHFNQQASSRLVFMSCNRQRMFNPFWRIIAALKPVVIIFGGDNIYADHTGPQWEVAVSIIGRLLLFPITTARALIFRSAPLFPPAEPSVIWDEYTKTLNHPEYQKMLQGKDLKLVTGTWDDHDYGVNDGDKTYIHRDISKQYLLDFLNIPPNDIRRSPTHEGVYGVEYIEVPLPPGQHKTKLKIAIILLDLRYNKDRWTVDPQTADFLGSSQWAWFELLLENSDADVHLIVSSIQVLVDKRSFLESWSGFPVARSRFLNTVLRSGAKNPIFLSGDVHFAEIDTVICRPKNGVNIDKVSPNEIQLWEFTSSGMTHATRRVVVTGGYLDLAMRWFLPTDHVDVRQRDGMKQMYTGRNIEVLDVLVSNDHNQPPILSFKILNSKSQIVLSKDLIIDIEGSWGSSLQVLQQGTTRHHPTSSGMNISKTAIDQEWKAIDWACDPLTGPVSIERQRLGVQLVFLSSFAFGLFLILLIVLPIRCSFFVYKIITRRKPRPGHDKKKKKQE